MSNPAVTILLRAKDQATRTLTRLRDTLRGTGQAGEQAGQEAGAGLSQIDSAAQRPAGPLRRLVNHLRGLGDTGQNAGRKAGGGMDTLSGKASAAAAPVVRLGGLIKALAVGAAARAFLLVNTTAEQLRLGFEAVTGSAERASQELDYVREVADRTGQSADRLAQQYLNLTAASQATRMEGQATRDIFEAVTSAMGQLGRSSDDTAGALLAIEQMISKGRVSAEELRQQLGERLPGAFRMAAEAVGVTTEELDKMLAAGELTADQLLPALAARLGEVYDTNKRAEGLTAAWGRFKNALTGVGAQAGETTGVISLLATGLNKAAEAIPKVYGHLETLYEKLRNSGAIEAFGKQIRDIFNAAREQVERFIDSVDVDALMERFRNLAASTESSLSKWSGYLRTGGQVAGVFFGAIQTGVNTILAAFFGLAAGVSKVVQGITLGLSKINEGLARITFGGVSEHYRQVAEDIRNVSDAMGASVEANTQRAKDALDRAADSGQKLRDRFTELATGADTAGAATRRMAEEQEEAAEKVGLTADALDALGEGVEYVDGEIRGLSQTAEDGGKAMDGLADDSEDAADALDGVRQEAKDAKDELLRLMQVGASMDEIAAASQRYEAAQRRAKGASEESGKAAEEASEKTNTLASSYDGAGDAIDRMGEVERLSRIRADLGVMFQEGEISADQYNESVKGVDSELRVLSKSSKEAGEQQNDLKNDLEGTKDNLKDTEEQAGKSAKNIQSVAAHMAAFVAEKRAEMEGLSKAALEHFSRLSSGIRQFNKDAKLTAEDGVEYFRQKMQEAGKELIYWSLRLADNPFSRWGKGIQKAAAATKVAFYEQRVEAEKLFNALEDGGTAGAMSLSELEREARRVESRFNLLDEQTLSQLHAAIDGARRRMEDLRESSQSTLEDMQDELLRLQGREDELARRQQERRKQELQAQLNEARAAGDEKSIRALQESLRVLEKIGQEEARQRQERDKERKQRERETQQRQEATRPAPRQDTTPTRTVRIELGGARVDVPEAQADAFIRELERAQRTVQ